MSLDDFWRDLAAGGWSMQPIILVGFMGLFAGVTGFIGALAVAQTRTLWIAGGLMAFGTLAPLIGLVGYALTVGGAEALTSLQYGVGAGLLPFCLELALVGIGLVRIRATGAQGRVRD